MSSDDVQIREARPADFEGVFRLFQQLHEKKNLDRDKVRSFYETLLASAIHQAWVASLDGKIIGYADVVFRTYHYAFEFVARLETIIVEETVRRNGIGSALMQVCLEEARAHGCTVLEFDSAVERTEAHRFYEKHGFSTRGHLFWKQL
jgi:N-acetylglutamate synthase-like GNAT family acetyltransferase